MAGPPPALLAALDSLVGAARAVLRDMETEDVPAPVRKVAAYTGKRLPPPLLKSLVIELDRNEWLRSRVRDEHGDDLDGIAAAFLVREDGWWMEITAATAEAAAVAASPVVDLEPEVARLEERLGEAKRRTTEARRRRDAAENELKALRKQLRSRPVADAAEDRTGRLEAEVTTLRARLDAETTRRTEAEERLQQLKRQRRKKTPQPPPVENELRSAAGVEDPVAAARRLDLQAAAMAAAVRGEPVMETGVEPELRMSAPNLLLPVGISPDSRAAIEWLVKAARPLPVIVDGYNLTFLMEPEGFVAPEARQRLVGELDRLLRHARAAHRILVVFDSSLDEESVPRMSEGGVEIVFATDADSADDEIVARAKGLDGRAVVITNDRELRERVDAAGALALWGTALVDWMQPS